MINQETFTKPLIKWYQENKRDLLFRNDEDPYKIWISEIMAQQTQIATMMPYFKRWIEKWPTVKDLSKANELDVLKAWEGLGYYSRARNILKASNIIMNDYSGEIPSTYQELRELPGIGDYTAGAISSIAFKKEVAAVDGNVIRVMARVQKDSTDYRKIKNKKELKSLLEVLMKDHNPSDFTQALMELGALVCKPNNPLCDNCPLNNICLSKKDNTQLEYPFKKEALVNEVLFYNVFFYQNDNHILYSVDDSDGLMKSLIRLPMLLETEPIPFENSTFLFENKHIFSHKTWLMKVFRVDGIKNIKKEWSLIDVNQINEHPWITAHKKILDKLL